jgi:hypothetical protein
MALIVVKLSQVFRVLLEDMRIVREDMMAQEMIILEHVQQIIMLETMLMIF